VKYCSKCGKELADTAVFCDMCGSRINSAASNPASENKWNIGFSILGFFFPIVGFILYLVYRESDPRKAKSAGVGALIGFALKSVGAIISAVFSAVAAGQFFRGLTELIQNILTEI